MDLNHGLPFVGPMRIRAGDYPDLAGAEVVVSPPARTRPGGDPARPARAERHGLEDVVPQVVAAAPEAVMLVATNPVDILTHLVGRLAGLPWGRVFGSGTVLDTARFRYLLGEHSGSIRGACTPTSSASTATPGSGLEPRDHRRDLTARLHRPGWPGTRCRRPGFPVRGGPDAAYETSSGSGRPITRSAWGSVRGRGGVEGSEDVLTVCSPRGRVRDRRDGPEPAGGRRPGGAEHRPELPMAADEVDALLRSADALRRCLAELDGGG